jgi:hypothetical protein
MGGREPVARRDERSRARAGARGPTVARRRIDPGSVVGFGAGWHGHLDALGALLSGRSFDLDGSYQRLKPVYEARLPG